MNKQVSKYDMYQNQDELVSIYDQKQKKKYIPFKKSACNLCGRTIFPSNKYERFCQECREENDVFDIHEWN